MSQQYPPQQPWGQQPSGQSWPQQTYYGQTGQQEQWQQQPYGQPQPQWQPMPPGPPQWQPLPKKSRKGLWIALGVVVALLVFGCIGMAALASQAGKSATTTLHNAESTVNTSLTQVATLQPTKAATQPASSGTWTTTHTFTGNGTQKTAIFTVGNDWKILYSCNGIIAGTATDGLLEVTVYGSDNTPIDPAAVNATCAAGSTLTKGETEEHQGGSVYLGINGTGDWTIQIQEPK